MLDLDTSVPGLTSFSITPTVDLSAGSGTLEITAETNRDASGITKFVVFLKKISPIRFRAQLRVLMAHGTILPLGLLVVGMITKLQRQEDFFKQASEMETTIFNPIKCRTVQEILRGIHLMI